MSERYAKNRRLAYPSRKIWATSFASLSLALMAVFALQIRAEKTRHWRQASFEDFSKGTAKGVALRSDGRLEMAPRFATLADADCAYLWAIRVDSRGNLFAAGGSNAKVLRMDPTGKVTTVFESGELAAQALAIDSHDNLYVGTSPDGKVYKISPSGEKKVFFEPKTKYIWDVLVDPAGTLYVASGDKGQIFAVAPDGKSEIFYSGDETHIRALAVDSKDNLLAGTEPNGLILRLPTNSPPGERHSKTPITQENARQDGAYGAHRQTLTGTQPASARKAFVLYETSKKEITALISDHLGNIYAAAIGEKQRNSSTPSPSVNLPTPSTITPGTPGGVTITMAPSIPQSAIYPPFPASVSSAVFRIAPDGAPEEVWNSRDNLVYSLGLSARGDLILGTGNDGGVIEIEGGGISSHLVKVGSAQVTAFARGPHGKTYLSTANPGKVFTLGPNAELEGSFESQTFDARIFSEWGRLQWFGDGAARGAAVISGTSRIAFYVRSGNTADPGKDWSPWSGPYSASGAKVESPPARFIQWEARWSADPTPMPQPPSNATSRASSQDSRQTSLENSPARLDAGGGIDWVSIAYLPKNVAPVIDAIVVQNPGIRIQNTFVTASQAQQPVQLKMPPPLNPLAGIAVVSIPGQGDRSSQKFEPAPQGIQQKGFQSVVWSAHDDNDDDLTYSVFYRGEGERDWKLLKDKIDQKYFSWDTTALPDGAYYLKLVASDSPSNPRPEALKTERESERFEIDNTPPLIEGLSANPVSGQNSSMRIQFEARDSASAIEKSEYSIDGREWMLVSPIGRLSDALRERYDFPLLGLAPGEHTVAVRVSDHFENLASGKTTFAIKAKP